VSFYTDFIDASILDLQEFIPVLNAVKVHRYTALTGEDLEDDGSKHLAMWTVGETQSERGSALTTIIPGGAMQLDVTFNLLYWEPTPEAEQGVADEAAAKVFLDLLESVRARFLVSGNINRAGSMDYRWAGAEVDIGGVPRWFGGVIVARIPVTYT
jgi:hypothetical protein